MKEYFNDVADVGQLYINYPMIESYQDFSEIPDSDFIDKKISADFKNGKEYKKSVIDNPIVKLVNFKEKMYGILKNNFDIKDDKSLDLCVEEILNIDTCQDTGDRVASIISKLLIIDHKKMDEKSFNEKLNAIKYQFNKELNKYCDLNNGNNYYKVLRKQFQYIIKENIRKANRIQTEKDDTSLEVSKEMYLSLKFEEILKKQNEFSRDVCEGYIWILNTCVFFIPEYDYSLLSEHNENK